MDINHSNRFHLAIEAGDLETAVPWYTNVLGCSLDMKEEGRWQDINFWGNELTLHASKPRSEKGNEPLPIRTEYGMMQCCSDRDASRNQEQRSCRPCRCHRCRGGIQYLH